MPREFAGAGGLGDGDQDDVVADQRQKEAEQHRDGRSHVRKVLVQAQKEQPDPGQPQLDDQEQPVVDLQQGVHQRVEL